VASDIEREIEKHIRFGLIYAASPATIAKSLTEHFDICERGLRQTATADGRCGFTWENSPGKRVRCTEDVSTHGPRHVDKQSWVLVGYENDVSDGYWLYGGDR
jgi:hypothetical protein